MNKQKEQFDVTTFLSALNISFEQIIPDEKPDFSIQTSSGNIGIEHTEFNSADLHSHDIRSVYHTIELIQAELKSELEKISSVNFVFNFSIRKPITKRIIKDKKTDLMNFFLSHLDLPLIKSALQTEVFHHEFKYNKNESEFIESIRIGKSPRSDSIKVSTNDMYWSGAISKINIQEIIDKKEKLVDLSKNPQNWLLIMIADTEYSDGAYVNETAALEFKSRFDKVYVFRRIQRKVYELKLVSR